jgi:hypothetical protein
MRRLGSLIVLLAVGFYVAWPAYSGYQIKSALDAKDAAALENKVDFPSVRESLRPVVAAKVEDSLKDVLKSAGPAGAGLLEKLREKILPQVVDSTLTKFVTAENIIKMHAEGKSFKEAIEKLAKDEAGKSGGLGGGVGGGSGQPGATAGGTLDKLKDLAGKAGIDPGKVLGGLFGKTGETTGSTAPAPGSSSTSDSAAPPSYGYQNIKNIGLDGPLGFKIGVAKDADAAEADLTAGMSFVNGDWKLTSLVPRF